VQLTKTELARQAFDAFNRRDVEEMLQLMDPAIEFYAPTAELANSGEPYWRHDGIRKYFADVERVWEELEVIPAEFREIRDHVLAFGRVYGRGEGGYIQDSPAQWVLTVRGQVFVRVRVFTSRNAALAAVGLEE
jgi:ketosteroid isomerase-like protein